jgi:DNA-binding transcriptional LysR family regulator
MRTGSVTNAGRSMHLSQPAVSRLIADLERAVGFRLFDRVKGSAPIATPEATTLYQEVERSFIGIQALRRIAEDIRMFRGGQLRIACLPALATSFVPSVIKQFLLEHPDVNIQLQTRSSSTVRVWVAAQQFDLGLATPAGDLEGLTSDRFLVSRGVCALPPGHWLAEKSVITPQDLKDEPFISLALEDPARTKIDRIFDEARVRRHIVVETQYAMTICGLVMRGVGCAILNPISAIDFEGQGLVLRRFEPAIQFEYLIYRPANRPTALLAQRFIDLMKSHRESIARLDL